MPACRSKQPLLDLPLYDEIQHLHRFSLNLNHSWLALMDMIQLLSIIHNEGSLDWYAFYSSLKALSIDMPSKVLCMLFFYNKCVTYVWQCVCERDAIKPKTLIKWVNSLIF